MDKSIIKFLNYVKKIHEDAITSFETIEIFQKEADTHHKDNKGYFDYSMNNLKKYNDIKNADELLIHLIKALESNKDGNDFIHPFIEFSQLCNLFKNSTLYPKEYPTIIFYLIKKTIDSNILADTSNVYNIRSINKKFKSFYEFKKVIAQKDVNLILQTDDDKLSEEDLAIKEILSEPSNNDEFKEVYNNLKKHYLDCLDTYNENDINIIIDSLKYLQVSEDILQITKELLLEDINFRKQNSKKNNNTPLQKAPYIPAKETNIPQVFKVPEISQREKKKIYHELKYIIDIENYKVVAPLKLDQIIYMISLMRKVNIPEDKIKEYLFLITKENLVAYKNSISKFNDYYNKLLLFSKQDENIEVSLELMKEYINHLILPKSNEEYIKYKSLLTKELESVLEYLPNDYTYELEMSKKLLNNPNNN